MSVGLAERPVVRRQMLTLDSLRALVNRALHEQTDCAGVYIRRIVVTEPDSSGCNWQVEWPVFRTASIDPCRSQLRELVETLRMRFNVEL